MSNTIVPCLWFDNQAEEAAGFYTRTFPAGRVTATSRYPESFDNPPGKPRGSVMTVEIEIAGQRFSLLNGGPLFSINPSVSFFVHVETAEAAEKLFATLAEGGEVLMPIGEYAWSPRYGWVKDRFGASWQIITGQPLPAGATIAPCLMFTGAQHGKAEEAMQTYVRAFPDARIDRIERYEAAEGPEGSVKHGRFLLAGQAMVAMDSHLEHGFSFNEGLSLQVICQNQAAVDHYWTSLSEGGEHGPCGWLKDRFGLSWQIVPAGIADWMASDDVRASERAFNAVMGMKKLDIAAIQAAFDGT